MAKVTFSTARILALTPVAVIVAGALGCGVNHFYLMRLMKPGTWFFALDELLRLLIAFSVVFGTPLVVLIGMLSWAAWTYRRPPSGN